MRAWIVLTLAISAGACLQPASHDPGVVEVGQRDCYTCHRSDFEDPATNAEEPHLGVKPTRCGDCHSNDFWDPALDGGEHPERAFPIDGGPHGEIACTDCHVPGAGTSAGGANVSCIGCHEHAQGRVEDQHDEVSRFDYDPSRPAFCRDCHPRGR